MTVTTCLAGDAPKGTRLTFETSGKLKGTSMVATQKGTTVSVEKLFHNLPVRRRELERNIKREWHKVISLLNQYACIKTDTKFSVSQQPTKGKRIILFSTKGNPTTRDNIINIFGSKTMSALIPLDMQMEMQPSTLSSALQSTVDTTKISKDVRIVGHVSRPAHGDGRQTPDRQMFFINGRPCGLPQFAKTFNEVYKSYNSTQSPFIFANIQLDTHMYDVNVSPDKRTILLHDQNQLLDSLRSSLVQLFDSHDYSLSSTQPTRPKQASAFGSQPWPPTAGTPVMSKTVDKVNEHEMSPDPSPDRTSQPDSSSTAKHRIPTLASRAQSSPSAMVGANQASNLLSRWLDRNGAVEKSTTSNPDARQDQGSSPGSHSGGESESAKGAYMEEQESGSEEEEEGNSRDDIEYDSGNDSENGSEISEEEEDEDEHEEGGEDVDASKGRPSNTGKPSFGSTLSQRFAAWEAGINFPAQTPKTKARIQIGKLDTSDGDETPQSSLKDTAAQSEAESNSEYEEPPSDAELDAGSDHGEQTEDGAHVHPVGESSQVATGMNQSEAIKPEIANARPKVLDWGSRQKNSTLQMVQTLNLDEDAVHCRMNSWLKSQRPRILETADEVKVEDITAADAESKLSLIISKSDFSDMRVVGQFNLGFIIAVRPGQIGNDGTGGGAKYDELFIIDQHASDEKYNFERLQDGTVVQSQRLVRPKRLELTALEEEILMQSIEAIEANGFKVEVDTYGEWPVGSRCLLTALPLSRETTFNIADLEELISLLGDESSESKHIPRPSKVRKMFAMRACRSSVMIGKPLTRNQMFNLVGHMGELDKPWNCPHGRPTMRHLCRIQTWDEKGWADDSDSVPLASWASY
ncbi:DNA mismatch repair protein PMS2 [Geosmithia morbida]|uniref:DNA mismatch repair protein PMS2 n=1 Tax=Geosmithia morbida TaxID=1094350 RepID=A0A9P5D710_9HYPO|nr:DNA mismatch repair protein PMS2 [Geosmithia morbida]KAF4125315.1 DNA mismatch repair protein PMS2 [Geosmithia morbida]